MCVQVAAGSVIAQRYHVTKRLGAAAFSTTVCALDEQTGQHVCLKIIKSNKDFFDQSLDEIKLLRLINSADPDNRAGRT